MGQGPWPKRVAVGVSPATHGIVRLLCVQKSSTPRRRGRLVSPNRTKGPRDPGSTRRPPPSRGDRLAVWKRSISCTFYTHRLLCLSHSLVNGFGINLSVAVAAASAVVPRSSARSSQRAGSPGEAGPAPSAQHGPGGPLFRATLPSVPSSSHWSHPHWPTRLGLKGSLGLGVACVPTAHTLLWPQVHRPEAAGWAGLLSS